MRCPTLSELPPPPPGKTGWPWTTESAQLPETMPDSSFWSRVSIVTPSYNQAQFIEETIRSVLLQGYPDLEYIIIDGGSTDGSVEIIRKYEPWLAYWVSEKDSGQSEAINKGFARATGPFVAWLNSDDTYEPKAINRALQYMVSHSTSSLVYSDCNVIDESGKKFNKFYARPFVWEEHLLENLIPQPSVFMRKDIFDIVAGVDESLHCIMDYDLWLRMGRQNYIMYVPDTWANFRVCQGTKSIRNRLCFAEEHLRILDRYAETNCNVPDSLIDAARRRWHLIASIESIRSGDKSHIRTHLDQALSGNSQLLDDMESFSWLVLSRILRISFLSVESSTSDKLLRQFLSYLPDKHIKRKVKAHIYMARAFKANHESQYAQVVQYGVIALCNSAHVWVNRGFLRVLASACINKLMGR